jgi:hypothetical protein
MAMIDAFRFLALCRKDEAFRDDAYRAEGAEGFRAFVSDSGYDFIDGELEDALRSMELRSSDEYEADEIKQLGQWYRMMTAAADPSPCSACKKTR